MAELTKALMKMRRHLKRSPPQAATYQVLESHILEELGDTQLLINQIKSYYTGGFPEYFNEHYETSKSKLKDKLVLNERVKIILTVGPEPKGALVAERLEEKGR